jgi:hypothetical protein
VRKEICADLPGLAGYNTDVFGNHAMVEGLALNEFTLLTADIKLVV